MLHTAGINKIAQQFFPYFSWALRGGAPQRGVAESSIKECGVTIYIFEKCLGTGWSEGGDFPPLHTFDVFIVFRWLLYILTYFK
jgi:hypothetical protein